MDFTLSKVPRAFTSHSQTERMVVTRLERRKNGKLFNRNRVTVLQDIKSSEDGWLHNCGPYLKPLNCHPCISISPFNLENS